ncbi:DMT family transporter [Helicobacter cetorum]|uniref:Membrane transport protein n=1 Tax=Helicobacter cetorum (strain ATCC BAA-540 / CCUG 52418 / MIT 99-5656) TaxID=1163745 RepID=I0ERW6_HELCM|nr:DMT family transporter [Helicobacter cetorum]AFI05685.1 membrane transport protein [Helicobacter cetorum MIT 99-5656]
MRNTILFGILMMFLANLCFGIMSAFVKITANYFSPMENVFYRSVTMMLLLLLIYPFKPYPLRSYKKGGFRKLAFRAVVGGLAMLAFFYNIEKISLATATAFSQSAPIYTVLLSYFMLKEKLQMSALISAGIGLVGVVLISNPSVENIGPFEILMGILSGVFVALAYVTLRDLREYYDKQAVILAFAFGMSVLGLVGMFFDIPFLSNGIHTPRLEDILWIFLIGVSGTLGQYFLTYAYMNAPAGIIAPIEYTRIIWGLLLGLYLGDKFLDFKSSLGVLLILFSGLLIALPALLKELRSFKSCN